MVERSLTRLIQHAYEISQIELRLSFLEDATINHLLEQTWTQLHPGANA